MKSSKKQSYRKLFKRIGRLSLLIIGGLLLIGYLLWLRAPKYISSEIVPELGKKTGLPSLKFKVRRLGLGKADLVDFSAANGSVSADSIRIDYRPVSYFTEDAFCIDNITASGIVVDCKINNGRFEIRYFNLQKFIDRFKSGEVRKEESTAAEKKSTTKLKIKKIAIKSGLLKIENNFTTYRVPFNMTIQPMEGFKRVKGRLEISLGSTYLWADFSTKLDSHSMNFQLIHGFKLDELVAALNLKTVNLHGKGTSFINGGISWNPLKVKHLSFCTYVKNFEAEMKGQKFFADNLSFELVKRRNILLGTLSGLKGSGIAEIDFKPVTGEIDLNSEMPSFDCKIPAAIKSLAGLKFSAKSPLLVNGKIAGKLSDGKLKLDGIVNSKSVKTFLPSGELALDTASIKFDGDPDNLKITGKNNGIEFIHKLAHVSFPSVNMSASYRNKKLSGSVSIPKGNVICDKFKVKTGNISVNCPFLYPKLKAEAKLNCAGVYWDKMLLGKAEGNMTLGIPRSRYSLTFDAEPFDNMKLMASGGLVVGAIPEFDMNVSLPEYNITSVKGLEKRFPAVKDFNFTAVCNAGMKFKYKAGVPFADAFINVKDGMFETIEPGFKISNIRLGLKIADLLKMRSLPEQKLNFDLIEAGGVKLVNGEVDFQIESLKSVLLERAEVGWCDGHIYTHALRLKAGTDTYNAIFYCGGIVLSELISQLGLSKATGNGTVLGRIPVRLDKNGLAFTHGYLYSVPGEGKKIKLMDTDKLLENIPKETQQFTQLDIASEALKDFDYKWVKLNLNTQGEELKLRMELNGKAAKALPFTYDKKKNAFIRIKGRGAKFQGIRLDVNSNIPLNRLMLISNKLKKILGGAKSR